MKQRGQKEKTYTYPTVASWKENGRSMSYNTQLYETGVYIIYNNNPAIQYNVLPQDMVNLVKNLQKMEKANEIVDLNFGSKIRVVNHEGFWRDIDQVKYKENKYK
jgi:NDP-sugar pyrophosphorylase family protein